MNHLKTTLTLLTSVSLLAGCSKSTDVANEDSFPATRGTPATTPITPTSERANNPSRSTIDDGTNYRANGNLAATNATPEAGVRALIAKDPALSGWSDKITVSMVNEKLVLRGEVETEEQKRNLEAAAKRAQGVNQVDNQITVKGTNAPAPQNRDTTPAPAPAPDAPVQPEPNPQN